MKNSLFLAVLLFSFVGLYAQKTLVPTDEGSKIHFVIKNFGINTGGDLSGMKGSIRFDAQKPAASVFNVTVDVSTIDTDNERRDKHLKNEDFFEITKYPVIRLASTSIEASNVAGTYLFTGNLTIKDVTKMVSFPFKASPAGNAYLFEGEFSINRLDYHVGSESATMGDEVKISLAVIAK